jgi:UDP-N-acetylmuramyl pentapeptide phosphotransferase/UDP-N-acetylglucosamine-1-phosphate transferase
VILALVAIGVVSALLGSAATAVARRALFAQQIFDVPNERSSHHHIVVRGAGIGMTVVWVAVVLTASLVLHRADRSLAIVAMAAGLSLLGLLDDIHHLSPAFRLAIEFVICAAAIGSGLAPDSLTLPGGLAVHLGVAALPIWTIWTVLVINLFNFMDGIDGLAASQTLVSGIVIGIVGVSMNLGVVSVLGVALAGVAAGFLPFNWSPARCFMGDAGSYFCGTALAGTWLLAQKEGVSLLVVTLPATGFFLDAAVTLIVRVFRGKRPWQPHRSHLYQRLVARGFAHQTVTLTYGFVATGLAAVDISLLLHPG